jgi:feruloyl-CoA synthase
MDFKNTPFLKIKTLKIDVKKSSHTEGSILLNSTVPLKKSPHRMTQRLIYWAKKTPDTIFLGQKNANGAWKTLTYSETYEKVKCIAQYLLNSGVSVEKPLAILAENTIEHALMALAALHIGIPYSVIAPAYSLRSTDYAKLRHTIDLLTPALIFVQNGKNHEKGFNVVAPNTKVIAVNDPLSKFGISDGGFRMGDAGDEGSRCTNFEDLLKTEPTAAVDAAFKKIKPDTIAKILFTSGSTGLPKGVINTHGNITINWQQITQTFPWIANGNLTFIDWMPWNHVAGSNHNFGITLFNGGSFYIDEGNPSPQGAVKTMENLRQISPTFYCSVPKGFEYLVHYLQNDKALCATFFKDLKLIFYAGSSMPQHLWDALEQLSYETTGKRVMISTGLGMTETSPSCMFNVHYGSFAGMLGIPVPGLTVKLIPNGGKLEVRFKAPNVMPGYWRNPEATQKAFDTEGYYCTGDALKFVDENDPNKGMIFDGRIAEDFKLDTSTWVSVGVLKGKLIEAGKGLIQDAVITGHDRSFIAAIVFPEMNYCKKLTGLGDDADLTTIVNTPSVIAALQTVLNTFAKQNTGSSTLVKRAVFADFNLSIDKGEITDKGSINQRVILANHADYVEMIYRNPVVLPLLEVQK